MDKIILGIWDGHDAGCALIHNNEIIFAINEERLSRRKLEIGFPKNSITAALNFAGLNPNDIQNVAFSTGDFAKTLSRFMPGAQEDYYQLRRRKKYPTLFNQIKKLIKYRLTEIPPNYLTHLLSMKYMRSQLSHLGIKPQNLQLVGHHDAHAAAAALSSGLQNCLVITLDGIGDGLSGSFFNYDNGQFNRIASLPGTTSLGIFYEHVTNILNMRELEDEGKVMAMASSTYPVPDEKNSLLQMFHVDGLNLSCRYSSLGLYFALKKELAISSTEQFAYMTQRTLEVLALQLVKNAITVTGKRKIAFAGGVASNVKLNRLIRELPEVEELSVFPHMGDGGLALGAAQWMANQKFHLQHFPLNDLYLGPQYDNQQVESCLLQKSTELQFEKSTAAADRAADLLSKGEIIMWFQGRMEFGPRALGARSILALPNNTDIRDNLNLKLKKRSWYQPYCPVMLEQEAIRILKNYKKPNKFMTEAYQILSAQKNLVEGVISPDESCRPQILDENADQSKYVELLQFIRAKTGAAILLNTSYNLHGEPIVCSPQDAVKTFLQSEINYLVIQDYIVTKKH